jgi:hypothetical protein
MAQDATWLAQNHRSDPDRYEGLLPEPNARQEYDVLAFQALLGTAAPLQFTKDRHALMVEYCRPPSQGEPAHIEVRQQNGYVNYLMKASPEPKGSGWQRFVWPSKVVVDENHIAPRDLGVVIHLGEDSEYGEDLSPAILLVAPEKGPAEQPGPIEKYVLALRIQRATLDWLEYTIEPSSGKPKTCYYRSDSDTECVREMPKRPLIEEGSLVHITLDLSGIPDGAVSVHLAGQYHDSDETLKTNLHFIHDGTCE